MTIKHALLGLGLALCALPVAAQAQSWERSEATGDYCSFSSPEGAGRYGFLFLNNGAEGVAFWNNAWTWIEPRTDYRVSLQLDNGPKLDLPAKGLGQNGAGLGVVVLLADPAFLNMVRNAKQVTLWRDGAKLGSYKLAGVGTEIDAARECAKRI